MPKDYYCEILYHPRMANVIADALSPKTTGSPIGNAYLKMTVISPLLEMIKDAKVEGVKKDNWKVERIRVSYPLFLKDSCGLLTQCGRVWVQTAGGVRCKILEAGHESKFSIYLGAMKMYRDLRLSYWWPYMKREISWFIEWCLTWRKVKVEH